MIVSKNDMDVQVAKFVRDHKNDKKENADTHTFYDEFFRIFGKERREVSIFEMAVKKFDAKPGDHPDKIDLFWPSVLLVEQKSADKTINEADEQADKYCLNLQKNRSDLLPRYILTSNFHTFHLRDLESKKDWTFKIEELPKKLGLFRFMTEGVKTEFEYEESVSMKASNIMTNIFKQLEESGYEKKFMEPFLARLTYCFFADDTGIFPTPHMFQKYITDRTDESNIGSKIIELFNNLDKKTELREKLLDDDLREFPYVNGGLFETHIEPPSFDKKMRDDLINASKYDWSDVSPMIFGSLFQNVMEKESQNDCGAHYTTEENILKVLFPMFLRKLWDEFTDIKNLKHGGRTKKLKNFQEKLSELKFFDPACGSGNFLTITYREIRRLEMEVISEIYDKVNKRLDVAVLSKISVNQFYGIEILPFPVKIAQTALWMMEHLMNKELAAKFGDVFVQLPLTTQPNIQCGDALKKDWNRVLDSGECSYVFGNPPYRGARVMDEGQKSQTREITGSGDLDYVCNWLVKSAQYVGKDTPVFFVTTNSISQGTQVSLLWKQMYALKTDIIFAHTSFKWASEIANSANVTVIIIGMSKKIKKRVFYDGATTSIPKFISPYLFETDQKPVLLVSKNKSINKCGEMKMGTQPIDGGSYIFTEEEKEDFLNLEPGAEKYMFPYVGGEEFIKRTRRWILVLKDIQPNEQSKLPEIQKRINAVIKYREKSPRPKTVKQAKTPRQFENTVIPSGDFLAIPEVSSENRTYIPIGYLSNPTIPSNLLKIIENADLSLFGLLTSKMHMVWTGAVGGKLETRFRYTNAMFNIFPFPKAGMSAIIPKARRILEIREEYSDGFNILYDKKTMPEKLLKAHEDLDRAVEKLYRKEPFKNDRERLKFLIEKYQKITSTAHSGPGIGGVD